MSSPLRIRKGTVQGVKHVQHGTNNQDAVLTLEFSIPARKKTYRIGLVSDGCSGLPALSYNEVGARLTVVYAMARIQELIRYGAKVEEIPLRLYHALINFLRNLANTIMPSSIYWPYGMTFEGINEFRNRHNATQRFTVDYLAATLLGFVDDGTTVVTFRSGDGVVIVDGVVTVIDQHDTPDYPALSVNSSDGGFATMAYVSTAVRRIALVTDGIEKLLEVPDSGLPDRLFSHMPTDPRGLQYLLNVLRKQYPEKMGDDCTAVTWERLQEVPDAQSPAAG